MDSADIEKMMIAYKHLFEIENKLRIIIKTNLAKRFGPNWRKRLNDHHSVGNGNYHDLIAFFGRYPQTLPHFSDHEREQLRLLIQVRNKIAHTHYLKEQEYELLLQCHDSVMSQPITKQKRVSKRTNKSVVFNYIL